MTEIERDVLDALLSSSRSLREESLELRTRAYAVRVISGDVRRRVALRRLEGRERATAADEAQALATSSVIRPR